MGKKAYIVAAGVAVSTVVVFGLFMLFKGFPASMSCDKAMDRAQAETLWEDNQAVVRDLESKYDSATGVSIQLDESKCSGKAFIHINYDTEKTRVEINNVIQRTSLKAVPIEWQNI